MNIVETIAKDQFLKALEKMTIGRLTLTAPGGKIYTFNGDQPGPQCDVTIHDWRVVSQLAMNGDNGLARAYQDHLWDTDDLPGLITLALMNEAVLKKYIFGSNWAQTAGWLANLTRINTRRGSRKNIHAHYDLGNEFYKLWLDPTMTYSAALFAQDNEPLDKAQHNKYDRIIDRLDKQSGSILEIGCGWGGFAERAVTRGNFDVKGVTLSTEQHDYATKRLNGNARIDLEDYRDIKGKFDNIVSIEMFEAVGEQYWATYFGRISGLLKQGGKAVIQTITIDDHRFDRYRRGNDMIRTSIFPGGMLPSPQRFRQEAARAGLAVRDEFHFGHDYAETLKQWLSRFDAQNAAVRDLGFDQKFTRLWRFYLAACIAGFVTNRTSVMQVELQHA